MKWILFSLIALMVSTNSFASKARLLALGEKSEFSHWIDDDRNIFQNVSNINQYKDFAIFEFGDDGSALSLDTDSEPKAQGGAITSVGKYVIGAYLGNESNTASLQKIAADTGLSHDDNVLDIFLGKTTASGLKWGWNFFYSHHEEEIDAANNRDKNKGSAMATRFGISREKWGAFANISIKNDSEDEGVAGDPKYKGKVGYLIGGNYSILSDWKIFLATTGIKWEQTLNSIKTDADSYEYLLGLGHKKKINDKITLFTSLRYENKRVRVQYENNPTQAKNYNFPLILAIEGKAMAWLTLRASIKQNVYGKQNNSNYDPLNALAQAVITAEYGAEGERVPSNSTDVSAGATLHFGDLNIDGLIGTSSIERNDSDNTAANNEYQQEDGLLTGDNILTRVSISYVF